MNKIHQLPRHEAQKIAAGEVVERPANVVKELLENALDAGATAITIYLENGGKKLIRIVDNGCGMSQEDAHMSIVQHATSKIRSVDELESLQTFGFRGEALSSIAAVSTLTLTTKEATASAGYKITVTHGTITHTEIVAAAQGTDIAIYDLFENVPARKKFLKTDETERRAIVQLFQALCLDYPNINFKLYHNDTLTFNCPATTRLQRIHQLFDENLYTHMHTGEYHDEASSVSFEVLFSDYQYTRYDRNALYFFVNKRWVKNYKLSQALIKGYMGILPAGKYPAAVVSLTVNPRDVDINIHPRKEEVQFLYPRIIENTLTNFIKKQLESLMQKKLSTTAQTENFARVFPAPEIKVVQELPHTHPLITIQKPVVPPIYTTPKIEPVQQTPIAEEIIYTVIGQIHTTYIIVETKDGIALIDQHAAHERILYEQFGSRFNNLEPIQLLFPEIITLRDADIALLQAHLSIFAEHGIIIEQTGPQQLAVTAVPVLYKNQRVEELIHHVISWIDEFTLLPIQEFSKKITEKVRAQMACKGAVKAGDILTHEKMETLIATLIKTDNRFTCPHGRPTHWNVSLYEIEKAFKRV